MRSRSQPLDRDAAVPSRPAAPAAAAAAAAAEAARVLGRVLRVHAGGRVGGSRDRASAIAPARDRHRRCRHRCRLAE